ncbi:MAG: hypothetical protein ACREPR_01985 [Brasilonema sp.]
MSTEGVNQSHAIAIGLGSILRGRYRIIKLLEQGGFAGQAHLVNKNAPISIKTRIIALSPAY